MSIKIFLDSGNPEETREAVAILGRLDGQTTNPTKISQHPEVQKRIAEGKKFSKLELYGFYKEVAQELSRLIPHGAISLEVYADQSTSAQSMVVEAHELFSWIPNAHIKFPIIHAGVEAAEIFVKDGGRVNMTLNFTQEQAAAVHCATQGAPKGSVFISPFIARLEDKGYHGMDLVKNIVDMYDEINSHVEVLAASIRNINHIRGAIECGADYITAPLAVLKEWAKEVNDEEESYRKPESRIPIEYHHLIVKEKDWRSCTIQHELTDAGLALFAVDWNKVLQ